MLFHSNRKAVNYPNLLINNINIENVAEFNFLGIQLNQNLKWKELFIEDTQYLSLCCARYILLSTPSIQIP